MGHLFVSYASVDRARMLEVVDAVRAQGIEVWIDQTGIAGGAAYGTEIASALRDADAHAERIALRDAITRLGTADLSGCALVGSSRACGACADAAFRARIARLWHGSPPVDDGPPHRSA